MRPIYLFAPSPTVLSRLSLWKQDSKDIRACPQFISSKYFHWICTILVRRSAGTRHCVKREADACISQCPRLLWEPCNTFPHSGQMPNKCNHCDSICSVASNLLVHIETHIVQKGNQTCAFVAVQIFCGKCIANLLYTSHINNAAVSLAIFLWKYTLKHFEKNHRNYKELRATFIFDVFASHNFGWSAQNFNAITLVNV